MIEDTSLNAPQGILTFMAQIASWSFLKYIRQRNLSFSFVLQIAAHFITEKEILREELLVREGV